MRFYRGDLELPRPTAIRYGCGTCCSWMITRGATGCGLSADIRIRICLQSGYECHFFHIHQYLYPYSYPYPKVRCGYGYGKNNILFVSDPISECWVLDNDIRIEETILQWNKAVDFDIFSSWKNNSGKYLILTRVTRDILSISTSTVASESVFSIRGRQWIW